MRFAGALFREPSSPRFPTRYACHLLVTLVLGIGLLALVVEAIFLAERSISIVGMIVDGPVGLGRAIPLLALRTPEVYLAIPLVLMIGTYVVLLRRRENGEFVALASSGHGPLPLVGMTMALAIAGCLFSLFVSGFVYPHAQYAFRHSRDMLRYETLRDGGVEGRFLHFPEYSIFVFPPLQGEARPVFVRQSLDGNRYRIINADGFDLIEDAETARLDIRLNGATVNTFSQPDERKAEGERTCSGCARIDILRTSRLDGQFDLSGFQRSRNRGVSISELTTAELLGWRAASATIDHIRPVPAEAFRRIARAMLCLVAPLIAWVTLVSTTRRSRIVALPMACAALMAADIGLVQLVTGLADRGLAIVLLALLLCVASAVGVGIWYLAKHQAGALVPTLARV